MAEKDDWGTVEVSNTEDKVEYEIEEKEKVVAKPEVKEDEVEDEEPKELEGIETDGAAKRIRQLVKQRKERENQVEALLRQNQELNTRLQSKNNEVTNISRHTLDLSEKQLTDKIALAREVYLEAFDEGEKEKLLNAQEMLNEAQNDLKQVTSAKVNYERQAQQPVAQPVQQQQQVAPPAADPKAEEWAASNDWFGKDNVMTAAALAIDAELKNEGYDPNDNDFYQEIDNRIKNTFPQKFGEVKERVQESTSTPAQVVSGSSRSSPSSKGKVKLTQEDMRLAEKWNIPIETYAAQKLKVTQADGEYTTIK
jgi:spore germination cell wall hydrolase CwlJ-like protein